MRRYIFGERDGIYIIDLQKTVVLLEQARQFAQDLAAKGGTVLLVGTKKQAKDAIKEVSEAAGMPYVNERWLGGLLTNFNTISKRIERLHDLHRQSEEGQLDLLPTKERMSMEAELGKLDTNLSGVEHMARLPDAVFVIDLKVEEIAVREARRLAIPTIGLVDTNCDPQSVDYVDPRQRRRDAFLRPRHQDDRRCDNNRPVAVPERRGGPPGRRGEGARRGRGESPSRSPGARAARGRAGRQGRRRRLNSRPPRQPAEQAPQPEVQG